MSLRRPGMNDVSDNGASWMASILLVEGNETNRDTLSRRTGEAMDCGARGSIALKKGLTRDAVTLRPARGLALRIAVSIACGTAL